MAYHEPMSKQKILVVGEGFGGIKAALELGKGDNSRFDITLVSDQANFRYYPALYRTATGGVVAGSSIPLMTILSDKKVKIIQGTAETIDRKAQTLTLTEGRSAGLRHRHTRLGRSDELLRNSRDEGVLIQYQVV